jgi:hypothetical protein
MTYHSSLQSSAHVLLVFPALNFLVRGKIYRHTLHEDNDNVQRIVVTTQNPKEAHFSSTVLTLFPTEIWGIVISFCSHIVFLGSCIMKPCLLLVFAILGLTASRVAGSDERTTADIVVRRLSSSNGKICS